MATESLFAALKNIVATFVAVIYTRLDLISTEIKIGRERLISISILIFTSFLFLFLSALLVVIFMIALFWDTHRLLALSTLAVSFFMIGGGLCWLALHKIRTMPKIFDATLNELLKDHDELSSRK